MTNQKLQADVIACNATIGGFEKGMQWQRALGLFEEMSKDGFPADVITYSATIGACRQARQWQRAVGVVEEMQSHRFQANVMTYGATISACAVASRLRVVRGDELAGNSSECQSATISACAKGGQWRRAVRLFEEMANQ